MSVRPLVAGSTVGFAAGWNIANIGAVAGTLALDYGVGLRFIGLLTTALFLVHLFMQIPAGRLTDRFGAVRVCAVGLLVLAACNALALAAPDPKLVFAARAAMGVGLALSFIGGSDYVRSTGGSPFAQGLYGGIATAGGGAALAVVPLLTGPLGWRAPFLSAIAITALAALLLAGAPHTVPVRRAGAARVALRTLARDRRLAALAVLFGGSFGLSIVIGNWIPTLVGETTGLGASTAGLIAGIVLALGVVSRPLGGWVLRAYPQHVRSAIAASATAGALGTLALASGSIPLAVTGAVAVGLAAGIPFAAAFTGAARLYPDAPGAAVGLVNGVGALSVLTGATLAGIAFEHGRGAEAFVVLAGVWVVSAVALGAAGKRPGSADR